MMGLLINTNIVVGLLVVFGTILCVSMWMWQKAFGSSSSSSSHYQSSPLTFYRMVGRILGLTTTYIFANMFWFESEQQGRGEGGNIDADLGMLLPLASSSIPSFCLVSLVFRLLSLFFWFIFFIHLLGFVEDLMVLKYGEFCTTTTDKEQRVLTVTWAIIGSVGRFVRAVHDGSLWTLIASMDFWWDSEEQEGEEMDLWDLLSPPYA